MATVRQSELTAENWQCLLAFLAQPSAGDDPGRRYEQLRGRLLAFFRWRGATAPEELADETLNRVARRVADAAVPNTVAPERYVLGVARLVLLEGSRNATRERRAHEGAAQFLYASSDALERERSARALELCLDRHASPELDVFASYHQAGRGRDRIAARARMARDRGLAPAALRVRMHRMRKILLDCIRACLGGDRTGAPGPTNPGKNQPGDDSCR